MISKDEVKKLAELARIDLSDDEIVRMQQDISSIIQYIDVIQKVDIPDAVLPSPHLDIRNVMREDGDPHETGLYTDALVKQFPESEGNYLRVKKILS